MINKTQSSQKLNFGWNGVTHQAITRKAASSINNYNQKHGDFSMMNIEKLVKAVILPDKIEKHKPHIADIDDLQVIDGLSVFKTHDKKARENLKANNIEQFWINAGKATHYLQDILCIPHVKPKKVRVKQVVLDNHRHFEKLAENKQDKILENISTNYSNSNIKFIDSLKEKMKEAKKIKIEKDNNKIRNNEAIEKSIKLAHEATLEYLSSLGKNND